MDDKTQGKRKSEDRANLLMPPDAAILIEARIKAGERNLQVKSVANLLLHDPILTLEFLQYANSVMYGGALVSDVEGAVTRLGMKRLGATLTEISEKAHKYPLEVMDTFEILRYNCRRVSIASLITSAVLRPQLGNLARTSGLLADVGHMLALHQLGMTYREIALQNKRKNVAFRLEKDHKFVIQKELVKFLTLKGVPRILLIPYDTDENAKNQTEVDLRLIVHSALELIDAYDGGRFDVYSSDKSLPSQSSLRLLKVAPAQQQKLVKSIGDYLKMSAADEAPEGTSLLISSVEQEEAAEAEAAPVVEGIRIPTYPNLSINSKSRDALQHFLAMCEREKDPSRLQSESVHQLKTSGLFERTALVTVSPSGDRVEVLFCNGLPLEPGQRLTKAETLAAFKAVNLEIRSAKSNNAPGPFGASAYALGAVEVSGTGEKVMLYVDRSANESLSMESRRVFRLALGLLMQKLQSLRSGGDESGEAAASPA